MIEKAEIISIGNELLIGKTTNTNAQWLSRRLTSLGISVNRITVIRDDVEEIKKTLKEAFHREPNFLITTGGLGPTFDDKTLQGVAAACNLTLDINKKALEMVKQKYNEYSQDMGKEQIKLTPPRRKMATIPINSEPIPNPFGTAPGITLRHNQILFFALPGVPEEMKAIFKNSLFPILKSSTSKVIFYETSLYVYGIMESEISPIIDIVMRDNSQIYIKSHPMGTENNPQIELHLSTTAEKTEIAKKHVKRALIQLSELTQTKYGTIRFSKSPSKHS